jgi:hypothetical protein
MIPLSPTQFCWMCGKAVTPDTGKRDEHGYSVHRRCHAAREALVMESSKLDRRNIDGESSEKETSRPAV